ncbi:MAG TPA: hypothetical protein VF059_08430 [Casimicrobiaceae bacterium]
MASALTLGPDAGRAQRRPHAPARRSVRAAPLSQVPTTLRQREALDAFAPMSARQREALHDLVHAPASTRKSRWAGRGHASDLAWAGVLALLLAACVAALLEDLGYLDGAGVTASAAQPHVDVRVVRAPAI